MIQFRLCAVVPLLATLLLAGSGCSSKPHVPTKEEAAQTPLPAPPTKSDVDRPPPPPPLPK